MFDSSKIINNDIFNISFSVYFYYSLLLFFYSYERTEWTQTNSVNNQTLSKSGNNLTSPCNDVYFNPIKHPQKKTLRILITTQAAMSSKLSEKQLIPWFSSSNHGNRINSSHHSQLHTGNPGPHIQWRHYTALTPPHTPLPVELEKVPT